MAEHGLTPTATLILAVLTEGPMHPYEILCQLTNRRDDRRVRLSPGAVYHAVERLEREQLVVEAGVERQGNRPKRRIYAITDAGRDAHQAATRRLVSENQPEFPAFLAGLALIPGLDRDDAIACLRARRAAVAASCAGGRQRMDDVAARGLPRRYLLDGYFEAHMVQAELDWLDATLADLESSALSWDEPWTGEFAGGIPPHP